MGANPPDQTPRFEQAEDYTVSTKVRQATIRWGRVLIWSAPAERSGDGAFSARQLRFYQFTERLAIGIPSGQPGLSGFHDGSHFAH